MPQIAVTGNTVIDALLDVSNRPFELAGSPLEAIPFDSRRMVLVTAHRRESFGGPFESDLYGPGRASPQI
jgi:UDP-N-acetylglucosamine 2-epimerase (non-hydrolysing)